MAKELRWRIVYRLAIPTVERGSDSEHRENDINMTVDMAVCVAAVSLNEELVLPAVPDSVLLMLVILSKEPYRQKDDPDHAAHRDLRASVLQY